MSSLDNLRRLHRRDLGFGLACGFVALLVWQSLKALLSAAFNQEQNSHIILVLPVIVTLLLFEPRKEGHRKTMDWTGVLLLIVTGAIDFLSSRYADELSADRLSVSVFGVVIAWIGLAVIFYGRHVLRRRAFLVLFLFLLIPIPSVLLDQLVRALQYASTRATQALFIATGIPVAREGYVLSLPRIDIEVAAECSGIRSSMMLLLTSLVLGHLFLASAWRQVVLLTSTVLITVLKNALRIYTLSMLAMYVDRSWIEGKFHHVYGGSVFFALALAMVLGLIQLLRRSGRKPPDGRKIEQDEVSIAFRRTGER